MGYQLWPIITQDGMCSVPDVVLHGVWKQMVAEGRAPEHVFYGGWVNSPERFAEFVKLPGVLPVFVIDDEAKKIVFFAWLDGVQDGYASGHFCALGPIRRGAFAAVIDYWRSWGSIRVLIGITPETNEFALRLIRKMGFTSLGGVVPQFCNLATQGRIVGAVISYLEL